MPAIMPLPREMTAAPGTFVLPATVRIQAQDAAARDAASFLADELARPGVR